MLRTSVLTMDDVTIVVGAGGYLLGKGNSMSEDGVTQLFQLQFSSGPGTLAVISEQSTEGEGSRTKRDADESNEIENEIVDDSVSDGDDGDGNTDGNDVDGNTDGNDGDGNTDGNDVDGSTDGNDVDGNTDGNDGDGSTDGNDDDGNTDDGNTDGNDNDGNDDGESTDGNDGDGNTDGNDVDENTDGNDDGESTDGNDDDGNTDGNDGDGNTDGNEGDGNTEEDTESYIKLTHNTGIIKLVYTCFYMYVKKSNFIMLNARGCQWESWEGTPTVL